MGFQLRAVGGLGNMRIVVQAIFRNDSVLKVKFQITTTTSCWMMGLGHSET